LGAIFDGWSDHLDLGAWRRALDEADVDVERELGERGLTDALPWDLIDAGVRKGYLKAEWRRAQKETETEDCKWGHCYRCGIPGDGADIKLAPDSLPVLGDVLPEEDRPGAAVYRQRPASRIPPADREQTQPPVYRRYRVTFSKTGDARWLSHRQTMDLLERIVRAAELPVRYTEGFNPHIKLSMGPALPVGHEGEAEIFDVDCTAPVRRQHIERANSLLPEGMEITDARPLLVGAPSLGKLVAAARYRIGPVDDRRVLLEHPEGIDDEVRPGIRRWQLREDGSLMVELNARQGDGPMISVKRLLLALGLDENRIARIPVTREALVLEARKKDRGAADGSAEAAVS
jgi:hypothetical protein